MAINGELGEGMIVAESGEPDAGSAIGNNGRLEGSWGGGALVD